MAKTLMFQGTASDVGKTLFTLAICRIYSQQGLKTAPFKSQNMAADSFITESGSEIAIAQALQAEAASSQPDVSMNPILMKPRGDNISEIFIEGQSVGLMTAKEYYSKKDKLLKAIEKSLSKLKENYQLIVLEGGGNPAEVNLKDKDLVNMKAAELADAPVILIADIERGGVFGSIIGTLELLEPSERERVKGIIINKFRGNPDRFKDGRQQIEELTGLPVLGVMPYLNDLSIPDEDSCGQQREKLEYNTTNLEDRLKSYDFLASQFREYINIDKLEEIIFN
ncbi:MAG: cobyric acid synthase [Halarsenatibacteraceae bacterium]